MLFDPKLSKPLPLPEQGSWGETTHKFDKSAVWAVRAGLASTRPLLLRGEPGIGKSQLARAAAVELKVPFLPHVIDERSERDDLLFTFDAVARLAEAQVAALSAQAEMELAKMDSNAAQSKTPAWRTALEEGNFFRPGVLWWAYNWASAEAQAKRYRSHCRECLPPVIPCDRKGAPLWSPDAVRPCGPVVLIDEIDKADPSLPNGLLECLGNQGFSAVQLGREIRLAEGAKPPLIFITTNEERELPAAFLRRCLVLRMSLPKDPTKLRGFLVNDRARVFWTVDEVSDAVCDKVIKQLIDERELAGQQGSALPGAAEFLDTLKILVELHSGKEAAQLKVLEEIRDFVLKKGADEAP